MSWAFAFCKFFPNSPGEKVGVGECFCISGMDLVTSLVRVQFRGSKEDPRSKMLVREVPGTYLVFRKQWQLLMTLLGPLGSQDPVTLFAPEAQWVEVGFEP